MQMTFLNNVRKVGRLVLSGTSCCDIKIIKWVLCRHGVSCPQVTDGGDGLQVWRVAANI
jgi:hypothetical protein